jgi:hypothetical protein
MLTEAFIRCGFFGDAGHQQRLDDLDFTTRADRIVLRRSVPHGDEWPDLARIVAGLCEAGYTVLPALIWRDKDTTILSQVKNLDRAPQVSRANIPRALILTFSQLAGLGLWPTSVYLGAFVTDAAVREAFFRQFGLAAPAMEFYDPDAKYRLED